VQVHTRPNLGENINEDIVFTQFFGLLPAVALTFDLLTPKANQHICEPKYICDRNWPKFPLLSAMLQLRLLFVYCNCLLTVCVSIGGQLVGPMPVLVAYHFSMC